MNLDANVQKILFALLRKWKLIVIFAIVGALAGYFYTANFTTLTYSSTVQFLAYATDGNDDIDSSASTEVVRSSNTSKMNYAIRMLDTYIAIMQTNQFHEDLVKDLNATYNANYSVGTVSGALQFETVSDTAMFKVTVTTTDAELSYKIAKQLEKTIPKTIKNKNQGLVKATVEDKAIRASTAGNLGYGKKCAIGAMAGIVLTAAYIILRTLLDVRVRTSDELTDKYGIPVLGTIPDFESRGIQASIKEVGEYVKDKQK